MGFMFLKTKLYIPQLKSGFVTRNRLIDQLNAEFKKESGFSRKLTLISAPAGYGKTTLVRQWVDDFLPRVAWLTLDENDNQLLFFLNCLIAAIRTVEKDACSETLEFIKGNSMLPGEPRVPVKEAIIHFSNDLLAIKKPLLVALEDYHHINNKEIQTLLTAVIENLPPSVHFVVTTRTDPPWPLHRWRVKRELMELRQRDISMVNQEAQVFLNDLMGCNLAGPEIELLMEKTEGWPASLQMVALSLKGSDNIPEFLRDFTGNSRYILDYFTDEVLKGQREELQEFLLKTSILDNFTATLCNHVLDRENSQDLLEELEKVNLFIIPEDNSREWYRYHPLFSQLLRFNLKKSYPESIEQLHLKASQWYADKNLPAGAIEHAIALPDKTIAIGLLEDYIEKLWFGSGYLQVSNWLEKLDEATINKSLKLKLYKSILKLLAGNLAEAEQDLHQVERELEKEPLYSNTAGGTGSFSPEKKSEIIGLKGMIQASLAKFLGDVKGILEYSKIAMDNLARGKSLFRPGVAIVSGDAHSIIGNFEKAEACYKEAVIEGKTADNLFFVQVAYLKLAVINWFVGNLKNTEKICKEHMEFARVTGMENTPWAGVMWALWGDVLREKNELDLALAYTQKGCDLSKRDSLVLLLSKLYFAQVCLSIGKNEDAQKVLLEIEGLLKKTSSLFGYEQIVKSLMARVLLKQDSRGALEYLKGQELLSEERVGPLNISTYLVMARALYSQGEIQEARDTLEKVFPLAKKKGMISGITEAQILKAKDHFSMGEIDASMQSLEEALLIGQREGYVRIFLEEGQEIIPILAEAKKRGIYPRYTQKLLSILTGKEHAVKKEKTPAPLLEPLSDRELEILTLISQGKSNQEIATALYVSLNTVKWHATNIYGKLSAQNRTDAVAKAKELNIID